MLRAMAAQLVHLPEVERLSPRIIRILGGNPGKYQLQGTNTYVVGTGPSRILIDTGEGKPSWPLALEKVLSDENITIDQAILTHWHHDHVSGVSDLLSFSPSTKIYKSQIVPSENQLDITHDQVFGIQGATLRAFHCPGHTKDHMALVLEEEDAMFTGDNVLGQGTAVFGDLKSYMDSLERMEGAFSGRAYPGHGPVIESGKAKVREYISHRREREEQVVGVLKERNEDGECWGSMQVVKIIYKDYPEHLHVPAEGSVVQVLQKLEKEGKVQKDGQRWKLTSKAAL